MNEGKLLFTPATPESLGISSSAILRFIETIEREQINMHGFLLLRHGRVAAEGYWAPFSKDELHRMYSVSKSFVSLAIGLLVDEGKLCLTDPVAGFFKDVIDQPLHPYLARATVRDLLMMASPHARTTYTRDDDHFAATFFQKAPVRPPGTHFSYDTSATVVLCTIVERLSGKPFLDYMRDKLLDPIGFSSNAWCIQTPEGTSWGGSGMLCTLTDMAKVAYVCMNQGRWNGQQLISEAYVQEATSKQIDNSLTGHEGYGYQIWCERNNGFSFRGMGSQYAICFPDEGLLFACIANTQLNGPASEMRIKQVFWENIYSHMTPSPLPADELSSKALNDKLSRLSILPVQGKHTSPYTENINEEWYHLEPNPMKISRLRFCFREDEGVFEYENDTGLQKLKFGIGKQCKGQLALKNIYGAQLGKKKNGSYECIASGAWIEVHRLNLLIYVTDDYLATAKMSFVFQEDEISVQMIKAAEWFMDEYSGFAGGRINKH